MNAVENERWRGGLAKMTEDDYNAAGQEFMSSFQVFVEGKAFFYTADGHVGIVPKYAQAGDQLCVLNNCPLPVLLRAEGLGYVLVGAVYVYGLFEEEPLVMVKPGQLNLQKFEIH